MGQSSSGEVSVQTQDPWSAQQPYLRDLFRLAQGMYTGRVYDYPSESSGIGGTRKRDGVPPGEPSSGSTIPSETPVEFLIPGGNLPGSGPVLTPNKDWTKTGEPTNSQGQPPYGQIPPELTSPKVTDAVQGTGNKLEQGITWAGNKIGEGASWIGNKIGLSKAGGVSDNFGGAYGGQEQQQNRTGATGFPLGGNTNPMPYADWAGSSGINIPTPQFATLPSINSAQNNYMAMMGDATRGIAPYSGLAASALAGQLNPWSNPYQQAAMSTLGSQTGALQSILGGGMAPGFAYAPNIGYGVTDPMSATFGGGANNANLYGTIDRMMTGTPNMNIWGPLMQQSTNNAVRAFNEQVMPGIRSESISAGAYGGPKHQQAMGLAAGRLGESIMAGQSGLAKEAAMAALGQQQAGAGLGSQLAQTGGQLNLGAQQLGGDIAKAQAQMGLQAQQGNQGAWNQYLDTLGRTAGTAGNLSSQAYQTGTSGINQAAAGMPQALQSMLMPANIQGQLGDYVWNLDQQKIQDKMNRFNMPYDMLGRYGQMITGQYGGTTSTPVQGKSPLASALGGAALGGSFGGPWGAAGGGLAGLLGLL